MATLTAQTPAARKAPASQQTTLAGLVTRASGLAKEGLPDMVRRMVSVLLDLTNAGADPRETMRRVKSGNLLKDNSYAFCHLAEEAFEKTLHKALDGLNPSAKPAAMTELSLVPLDEIDEQLALGAVSRPFDIQYADKLATLGVRLGLLLGRDLVRAAHNPFRPEVFLAALRSAWCEFEPDPESHSMIAPLLRPEIMIDLAPVYDALIAALVPPRGRKELDARFSKTDDRAARKAERARREAQLRRMFDGGAMDADLDIPMIPNLPQGSGGWRPSAANGFAVAAPVVMHGAQQGAGMAVPAAGFDPATHSGVHAGAAGAQAAGTPPGQVPADKTLLDLLARLGASPAGASGAAGAAAGAMADGGAGMGMPAAQGGAPFAMPVAPAWPPAGAAPGAMFQVALEGAGQPGAIPHAVFYLPQLRQSVPRGSLPRADETTLDLLARVFETVLLDDAIPHETRELIAFLQVPVLKAALRDRSFFYEEAHPARRMLDLLSQTGWERPAGADDPVYRAMRSSVERVHGQEQPEFAAALAELEASIAARDSAEQAAIAGPIEQATRHEKRVVAERSAQRLVAQRLAGEEVVELISGFLEQRWTPVLSLAYSVEESRPGAVDNATRTMDDLIWSVKPKATQEQRQALIKRLPALLGALNKWLDATRWQDGERLQFFAGLAECHAAIVRAPIELSPERQLELAVEAAQQDAMRRVAQEQALEEEAAAADAGAEVLGSLERGARFEFRLEAREGQEGGLRRVRLAWISPLRTLFIFSGAGRREAFSLSAERLANLLESGAMRALAPEGVVERVLSEAANEDGDADPMAVPLIPGL